MPNQSATRSETCRQRWADITPEERERRAARNTAARRRWWATRTPEEHADLVARAVAARRYEHGSAISRTKYERAGVPSEEIEVLLAMSGRARKLARLRWRDYGIRPSEVAAMLAEQNGLCGLCDDPLPAAFHVDHDHASGGVRGLLCGRCNLALGHVEARGEAWTARALQWISHQT